MQGAFRIITHGCRLNQAESRLLDDAFVAAGWRRAGARERADLIVVNTCCVTGLAEAKCRQSIRQAAARNKGAFVAVVGCLPQARGAGALHIEGVDLIAGNADKLRLPELVAKARARGGGREFPARFRRGDFRVPFEAGGAPFPQRASLKVQEGCAFACAYCIVPRARGPARSRDFADAVAEARALAKRGVRELVLTGVNIGMYSFNGYTFLDLVDAVSEVRGIDRVRLSSVEPTTVPAEGLFARMRDAAHPLLPYLHMPAQSLSEGVLKKMRRRHTAAEVLAFAEHASRAVPGIGLGTDIMVGHPFEDAAAFSETCAAFERGAFQYAHVFSYSEREGTLSAKMGGVVPVAERHRRSAVLRALSEKKHAAWARARLGETAEVLFENPRVDGWPGLTGDYLRVFVPKNGRDLRNRLARVKLLRLRAGKGVAVEGEVVSAEP